MNCWSQVNRWKKGGVGWAMEGFLFSQRDIVIVFLLLSSMLREELKMLEEEKQP